MSSSSGRPPSPNARRGVTSSPRSAPRSSPRSGSEGYRGCAFINAASEFEDPESPVRRVVADHRRWYYERVRRAFADAGHKHPSNPARHFVMLRDGAVTAGYLDSATAAQRTFTRGVDGLLRSIDIEILPDDDES